MEAASQGGLIARYIDCRSRVTDLRDRANDVDIAMIETHSSIMNRSMDRLCVSRHGTFSQWRFLPQALVIPEASLLKTLLGLRLA